MRTKANARFLMAVPSLSDFFFFSILAWLIGPRNAGWMGLLGDCDTGWHIRTGDWILAHGAVPKVDLFSFSKAGQPWFAWEWLTDVLFSVLHSAGGLKAIVLFAAMVLCTVGWLVLRECVRESGNGFAALAVALLSTGASSVHFLARPHILTMLLLAISIILIRADRREAGRRIWLLVPMTVLWTNLHGGFMAIVACLGLLTAGTVVELWLNGARRWEAFGPAIRYAKLTAACAMATVVNPYGLGLHGHVVEYLGADWIKKAVEEFQSPSFRSENMLQLEVLILLGVLVAGLLLRRRQVVEALWILFWAHQTLVSVRHAPLFLIITAPLVAGEIGRWWRAAVERQPAKSTVGILDAISRDIVPQLRRTSVWIAAPLVVLLFVVDKGWPTDFPDKILPVQMVSRHPELAGKRVFTADQWGDYLIYRFYPKQRVFFDGRSDFYGEELGKKYQQLSGGNWRWHALLEEFQFEYVMVSPSWALASLLKMSPEWRLVDDNGTAVLFERVDRKRAQMGVSDVVLEARAGSQFRARGLMESAEPAERVSEDSWR